MHRLRRLSAQLEPRPLTVQRTSSSVTHGLRGPADAEDDPPLLDAEQELQFRRDGFVNAGSILEEDTLAELSVELDRVLAIGSDGMHGAVSFTPFESSERPVIQIVNMWEASEAFARVCSHPKIVRVVRQLIRSDDFLVWHDQMQYKVCRCTTVYLSFAVALSPPVYWCDNRCCGSSLRTMAV